MLVGTADPARFEKEAPTLARFDARALELRDCVFVQVLSEIDAAGMCAMLPPALHPTLPPVVGWSAFEVPDSEWGAFRFAQLRIECRSGLRPRGLLVGCVVDSEAARSRVGGALWIPRRAGRGPDRTRLRRDPAAGRSRGTALARPLTARSTASGRNRHPVRLEPASRPIPRAASVCSRSTSSTR